MLSISNSSDVKEVERTNKGPEAKVFCYQLLHNQLCAHDSKHTRCWHIKVVLTCSVVTTVIGNAEKTD